MSAQCLKSASFAVAKAFDKKLVREDNILFSYLIVFKVASSPLHVRLWPSNRDDVLNLVYLFLVTCYATLHPALSVRRLVGRSPLYFFYSFYFFDLTAPAQMV